MAQEPKTDETVTCAVCEKQAAEGQCTRAIVNGESVYAHDACAVAAFDDARNKRYARSTE